MIADKAIYVNGRRVAELDTVQETYEVCREKGGGTWIGFCKPFFRRHRWVVAEAKVQPHEPLY